MLFEKLVDNANYLWDDYINHQFVHDLVSEKLNKNKFKNYLEQDYIYLKGYNECFKLIAKECSDEFELNYFTECSAIESEMKIYQDYMLDLTDIHPSKTTNEYLNYMYEIMIHGTHLQKIIVILPCIVGYGFIAKDLAVKEIDKNNYYKKWIDLYQSEEFTWPVRDLITIVNSYEVTKEELTELQEIFNYVCKLEIKFFNQALEPQKVGVLTIAGSDCSGGAGIQADIKTISANGAYAASVITAITAQNTMGVTAIENVATKMVEEQMDAVLSDLDIKAIKIGMLADEKVIQAISNKLNTNIPVILDPVMVAKDNTKLINDLAINDLVKYLFPKAFLVTPNIVEASKLLNMEIDNETKMKKACLKLSQMGCKNVLLKGGHLKADQLVDVLYANEEFYVFYKKRIPTKDTHGTGCSLSSAIATNIAKGLCIEKAVELAIDYVYAGIKLNYSVGRGCSPINHFHEQLGRYYE